jgi:Phycobilisome degradation protein nblA
MDSNVFELTLEQEFQMRLIQESAQNMSREQMQDMLLQTSKLLMIKDNAIRNMMKKGIFSL